MNRLNRLKWLTLWLCTACSTAPVALERLVPEETFPAQYCAQISAKTALMNDAVPCVEGSQCSTDERDVLAMPDVVEIEVRIVQVAEALARQSLELNPSAVDAKRFLRSDVEELLEKWSAVADVTHLAAPRMTVEFGKAAYLSLLNQQSYVSSFEVSSNAATCIADPVVEVLQQGLILSLRPERSENGIHLTISVKSCELVDPVPEVETELPGSESAVTIQLPLLKSQTLSTTADLGDPHALLMSGLWSEDSKHLMLLFVTASERRVNGGR